MRYDGRTWIHFSEPQLASLSQTEHWKYPGSPEGFRSATISGAVHALDLPFLLMVGALCWTPVDKAFYSAPAVCYGPDLPAGSIHLEIKDDHQRIVLLSPSALGHTHMVRGLFLEEEVDPNPYPLYRCSALAFGSGLAPVHVWFVQASLSDILVLLARRRSMESQCPPSVCRRNAGPDCDWWNPEVCPVRSYH